MEPARGSAEAWLVDRMREEGLKVEGLKVKLDLMRMHSLNCPTPDTFECECLPRASAAAFARILSALFEAGLGGEAVRLILRRDRLTRGEFKG